MSCLETYATLRVFSHEIAPEEIGRLLAIDGSKLRPINPGSRYRHEREHHYWAWSTQSRVLALDGLQHVGAIIEVLRGKEVQLDRLRQLGCDIDICCYWVSSGQGGPRLDIATLRALARLELEIWWDVYFADAAEYVEKTTDSPINDT